MAAILTGVTDRFSQNKKLDQFKQISVERSLLYGILAICAYGDKNGDNGANGANGKPHRHCNHWRSPLALAFGDQWCNLKTPSTPFRGDMSLTITNYESQWHQ